MGSNDELERSGKWKFDFTKLFQISQNLDPKNPVVPVVVQDAKTKDVLIVAYANQLALETTFETAWPRSGGTRGTSLDQGEIIRRRAQDQGRACELRAELAPLHRGASERRRLHVQDKDGKSMTTCYYRRVTRTKSSKAFKLEALTGFQRLMAPRPTAVLTTLFLRKEEEPVPVTS